MKHIHDILQYNADMRSNPTVQHDSGAQDLAIMALGAVCYDDTDIRFTLYETARQMSHDNLALAIGELSSALEICTRQLYYGDTRNLMKLGDPNSTNAND